MRLRMLQYESQTNVCEHYKCIQTMNTPMDTRVYVANT